MLTEVFENLLKLINFVIWICLLKIILCVETPFLKENQRLLTFNLPVCFKVSLIQTIWFMGSSSMKKKSLKTIMKYFRLLVCQNLSA